MYQDIILLMTIFFSVLWLIKKHYDNAWDIENLQIQLKNLKYKSSDFNKESEKDIANLRAEIVSIIQSMRKMQDDIIAGNQNNINIDGKYRIKIDDINKKLEKYDMPMLNDDEILEADCQQCGFTNEYDKKEINSNNIVITKDGLEYINHSVTIHDAMQNRTSAEKAAYDKLAKQISGSNI